ncbi:hypothetical protein [Serratia sp. (in: enterobacteria)]|uniref:hypothetical protein n=1 Tax=Serratia sp. (in: enterobacteria) TaxID=616 RepID=UPI0039895888
MVPIKVKAIITAIIIIITAAFLWLFQSEDETLKMPPIGNNTLYVQSSLPGECRAIITSILDDIKSTPNEIPCKVQLRLKVK